MHTSRIAAAHVAVAGIGFGREVAAGGRAVLVDLATDALANSALERHAAPRLLGDWLDWRRDRKTGISDAIDPFVNLFGS